MSANPGPFFYEPTRDKNLSYQAGNNGINEIPVLPQEHHLGTIAKEKNKRDEKVSHPDEFAPVFLRRLLKLKQAICILGYNGIARTYSLASCIQPHGVDRNCRRWQSRRTLFVLVQSGSVNSSGLLHHEAEPRDEQYKWRVVSNYSLIYGIGISFNWCRFLLLLVTFLLSGNNFGR